MVKANGGESTTGKIGKPIMFTAAIEIPPNTGKIISAEWDFEGAGTFPDKGKLIPDKKTISLVTVKTMHIFTKTGTYFPTLRVASQRQGDKKTPFTQIKNLGSMRVVVK